MKVRDNLLPNATVRTKDHMVSSTKHIEDRFLAEVKHHLAGLQAKIDNDFSMKSYSEELADLRGDPVYSAFALDSAEYTLVRLMGRMSISIGRRLGEIYDKIPRYVAAARFNVSAATVAEKFEGLELDIGLRYRDLQDKADVAHVKEQIRLLKGDPEKFSGIGIEIRYNFNPNDSSRLRKDCDMASHLIAEGLFPIYLIYSSISPRDEAIARLKRAGWLFLAGKEASDFSTRLFSIDFMATMRNPAVWEPVQVEVRKIMRSLYQSTAFAQVGLSQRLA